MKNFQEKPKFKRPKEKRGRFNIGKTIRKRLKEVHKRTSKYCFVALAERKSRQHLALQVPNKSEKIVTEAIIQMLSSCPSDLVKTITCDCCKEFAGYEKIEKELNCEVYFADPYCAWQRGTNENWNGLLRESYPKGMNLSKTNNKDLKEKLNLINYLCNI